jgi:uncharacterized membrane protein
MNTVFKFYYQAWILWSLAAAFGTVVIVEKFKSWKTTFLPLISTLLLAFLWMGALNGNESHGLQVAFRVLVLLLSIALLGLAIRMAKKDWGGLGFHLGLAAVLFMALVYPALGLAYKTDDFKIPAFNRSLAAARNAGDPSPWRTAASVWTLDGTAFGRLYYRADMAGIDWLQTAPTGVIVEATDPGASYRFEYGMVSTFTGLPTVLGWPGHEGQWRPYELQGSRLDDITRLYETHRWDEAQAIIQQYNIRYIFIGTIERSHYTVYEAKFQNSLIPVFQQGQVVIYEVPQ